MYFAEILYSCEYLSFTIQEHHSNYRRPKETICRDQRLYRYPAFLHHTSFQGLELCDKHLSEEYSFFPTQTFIGFNLRTFKFFATHYCELTMLIGKYLRFTLHIIKEILVNRYFYGCCRCDHRSICEVDKTWNGHSNILTKYLRRIAVLSFWNISMRPCTDTSVPRLF